jgi:hypothetical protein
MIKRKHIEHVELLELGKMFLLLSRRQQIRLKLLFLTNLDNGATEVERLARAS